MKTDWCRHYSGILDKSCRAGISYQPLRGRAVLKWPCHLGGQGSCVARSFPTAEEVKQWEQQQEEHTKKTLAVLALIQRWPEPRGIVFCPMCGTRLLWSQSSRNGHLHAKCDTPGCFQVMQ